MKEFDFFSIKTMPRYVYTTSITLLTKHGYPACDIRTTIHTHTQDLAVELQGTGLQGNMGNSTAKKGFRW